MGKNPTSSERMPLIWRRVLFPWIMIPLPWKRTLLPWRRIPRSRRGISRLCRHTRHLEKDTISQAEWPNLPGEWFPFLEEGHRLLREESLYTYLHYGGPIPPPERRIPFSWEKNSTSMEMDPTSAWILHRSILIPWRRTPLTWRMILLPWKGTQLLEGVASSSYDITSCLFASTLQKMTF